MADFINSVDILGDDAVTDMFLQRTLESYADDVITTVRDCAFYGCNELTSIDLPNATSIGASTFYGCTSLTSVNIPLVTTFNNYVFQNCTSLASANLPMLTNIGSSAFKSCSNLSSVNIPLVSSLGNSTFEGCSKLTMIELPLVTSIGTDGFWKCSSLISVILRSETVCKLKSPVVFSATPIASGTGYIYVPRALLSDEDATKDYRRATNWTTYANQFRAIEDWTVDGTVTGDMDIENRHMVRFFDEDGTLLGYTVVTTGSTAVYPYGEPVKEGEWKFIGWSEDLTSVTADIDCYAQFMSTAILSDKLVERTLSGDYTNDRVESVGDYVFYRCTNLTSIDLPNATNVGQYAFHSCSNLTSVDLPKVTNVGQYAFYDCKSLTNVDSPLVTDIGNNAFQNCQNLTSINTSLITTIGNAAFRGCYSLTSIDLPNATSIGASTFYSCMNLTSVNMPLVTTINSYVFESCRNLTSIDLPKVTKISSEAFKSSSSLTTLILRSETMCTIDHVSAFYETPIASGTGYVYVPAALVDSYKAASKWSTYAAQIRAIEDYPDICGGVA